MRAGHSCAVLGIETSCDETGVALYGGNFDILSNVILSQEDHAVYAALSRSLPPGRISGR